MQQKNEKLCATEQLSATECVWTTVCDWATVCDWKTLCDWVTVCDWETVCDWAIVCNRATVYSWATVCNWATVCHWAIKLERPSCKSHLNASTIIPTTLTSSHDVGGEIGKEERRKPRQVTKNHLFESLPYWLKILDIIKKESYFSPKVDGDA